MKPPNKTIYYRSVDFIIPLHLGKLNDLTSHLTRPMDNRNLDNLQEAKHKEEPSFSNKFINHIIHSAFTILEDHTLRGSPYITYWIGDYFHITFCFTLKICIQI